MLSMHNRDLGSSLTKQEILDKYHKLYDDVAGIIKNLESSYIYQHISMMSELLNLYRTVYNTNGKPSQLKDIQKLQYDVDRLDSDILELKEAIDNFIKLTE